MSVWKTALKFQRAGGHPSKRNISRVVNGIPSFRERHFFLLKAQAFSFVLPLFLASCATIPPAQPKIDRLVITQRYDRAIALLNDPKEGYGKNNELLYLLDKGLVLHLAGQYEESIAVFEKAKKKSDELYTQSITRLSASLLLNDYTQPYRGEDFERVLINVFQALNFVAKGDLTEALVEARDVDTRLNAINAQYPAGQKNVYREDAFARLLMGILYEAGGSPGGMNDAFISYQKALSIYENDYRYSYGSAVPLVLIENLISASEDMGEKERQQLKGKYPEVVAPPLSERKAKGEVYLIQYAGLSPLKIESSLVFPLPGGYFSKVAFPKYRSRTIEFPVGEFCAKGAALEEYCAVTEVVEDINAIAQKNLENRRARVIAKSVSRSGARYFLARQQEGNIKEKHGEEAAGWFRIFASYLNFYVEQPDLRTWQTLPAQIRVARLILPPGEYQVSLDTLSAGTVNIISGEKKFVIVRTR